MSIVFSQNQIDLSVWNGCCGILNDFLMLSGSEREQRLTAAGVDASGLVSIIILASG